MTGHIEFESCIRSLVCNDPECQLLMCRKCNWCKERGYCMWYCRNKHNRIGYCKKIFTIMLNAFPRPKVYHSFKYIMTREHRIRGFELPDTYCATCLCRLYFNSVWMTANFGRGFIAYPQCLQCHNRTITFCVGCFRGTQNCICLTKRFITLLLCVRQLVYLPKDLRITLFNYMKLIDKSNVVLA